MLQAIDASGNKYHSFIEENSEQVKELDQNRRLLCPDCRNPIQLKSGPVKINHFAHRRGHLCTDKYSEPESPQHLKGKISLKAQLERMHPNSRVELEYKVQKTNQRSDVMVIHPDGKHEAFEFQCSPISEAVMNERHTLYKQAGVKDYWIFGETVHSYHESKDDNYNESSLHKFRGMELAVQAFQENLYYINTNTERLRALYNFNYKNNYSKTVFHIREESMDLGSILKFEDYLMNSSIKSMILNNREAAAIAEEERVRNQKEKEKKEELRKEQAVEEKRKRMREIHHTLNNKNLITKKEEELYNTLMQKHGYQYLPGCFNIAVEHNDMIITPNHVWQLWIYDEFIHHKNLHSSGRVFVSNIKDSFWKMINKGVFRAKRSKNNSYRSVHFSYPIYAYISALAMLDVLSKLSYKRNYYSIEVDEIKPFNDKWKNILLSIATEEAIDVFDEEDSLRYHFEKNKQFSSKADELINDAMLSFLKTNLNLSLEKYRKIEELKSKQKQYRNTIQYIHNLSGDVGDTLSEWERNFIKNSHQNKNKLTEKQLTVVDRISTKVEQKLNISLSMENI
ncbi:competence protein CoiA [Guptibacillus spartinae]|uniref:competence protein CoiA n=1 Tax=Guptibacillus spartinae TaxID=3025679 RepID=UPI0023609FFE|nr:competence protein CoiA family protein [Pseudalkalibacillus spartinae]